MGLLPATTVYEPHHAMPSRVHRSRALLTLQLCVSIGHFLVITYISTCNATPHYSRSMLQQLPLPLRGPHSRRRQVPHWNSTHPGNHYWISESKNQLHSSAVREGYPWVARLVDCRNDMRSRLMQQVARGYNSSRSLVVFSYHGGLYENPNRLMYNKHVMSINEKYCKRWRCTFKIYRGRQFCDQMWGPPGQQVKLHYPWCKLLVMKQQVLKDFPDHDYYLWLDGDAAIIDHNLDMRLIPEAVPGATIYMSEDWWKAYPLHEANTGVLLFVNTPQLEWLLTQWLDAALPEEEEVALYRTEWDWEQRMMNTVMLQQHRRHMQVLPGCWLFDQPINLLDQVLVAHMCQTSPVKVQEKLFYYGHWDRQWLGEGGKQEGSMVV